MHERESSFKLCITASLHSPLHLSHHFHLHCPEPSFYPQSPSSPCSVSPLHSIIPTQSTPLAILLKQLTITHSLTGECVCACVCVVGRAGRSIGSRPLPALKVTWLGPHALWPLLRNSHTHAHTCIGHQMATTPSEEV